MTLQEFSDEFDIQYDSIAGKSNTGIDAYEKSVYLTRAQLELVKNYYDPNSNRKQKGFEGSEKRRVDLKSLILTHKESTFTISGLGITNDSKFFKIPNNVMFIVYEQLDVKRSNCSNVFKVLVTPVTHDEISYQLNNPFKNPSKTKAWRLDSASVNKEVEIIYPGDIENYTCRYIKYPKPIILEDLEVFAPNDNLSIDGLYQPTPCELDIEIHPEILNRAVELALGDYSPQTLESKMTLDTRNE